MKLLSLIIILQFLYNIQGELDIISNQQKIHSSKILISCLEKMIDNFLNDLPVLIIRWNNYNNQSYEEEDILQFFGSKEKLVQINIKGDTIHSWHRRDYFMYNIIMISKWDHLMALKDLASERFLYWPGYCRYLIIINEIDLDYSIRLELMQYLWKTELNNIVLITKKNNGKEKRLEIFYPYTKLYCNEFHSLKEINRCDDHRLFKDKLRKFHKCRLQVTTTPLVPYSFLKYPKIGEPDDVQWLDGIEPRILKLVSEALGFTPRIYASPDRLLWGYRLKNGSWVGLMGQLYTRKAHIGFSSLTPNVDKLSICEVAETYSTDSLSWAVPIAKQIPLWMNFILPFDLIVWILIILVLCLVLGYFGFSNVSHISAFHVFGAFLGDGFPHFPNSWLYRIFLGLWLFYSLIVANAYLGALASLLTVPKYEPDIDTMEQLLKSKIPFGSGPNFPALFRDPNDPIMRAISKGYQLTPHRQMETILINILNGKQKFSIIHTKAHIDYVNDYYKANGSLHVMKQNILTFPIMFYLPHGSFLLPSINRIVPRIVQSGLVNYWVANYSGIERHKLQSSSQNKKRPIILQISHLQGIFFIWIVGLSLSCLLFILELISKRIKN